MKSKGARGKARNVSPQQERAIVRLLNGETIDRTAKAIGVARKTVSDWVNQDPAFSSEFGRRQGEIYDRQLRVLMSNLDKAVDGLGALTHARDEGVRLRACVEVIDRFAQVIGRIPGGKEHLAAALGVQVNTQVNVAVQVAPDLSSTDRMLELSKLFTVIPALPTLGGITDVRTKESENGPGNGKML